LVFVDRVSFTRVADEAAAPVVNGEGVGHSVRINFDAAIGDGLQFYTVAVDFFD
jgi:hypothetical protein